MYLKTRGVAAVLKETGNEDGLRKLTEKWSAQAV